MPVSYSEDFPERPRQFDRENLYEYARSNGNLKGKELAMFMANMSRESGGFTKSEESGHYSTAERIAEIFPSKFYKKNADGKTYSSTLLNPSIKPEDYVNDSQKLFNHVYAGRNGNTQTGDGYNFRGRGYVHLTGRDNYKKYSKILFDMGLLSTENALVDNPDLAADPEIAAAIAVEFWKRESRPEVEALPNKWDDANALKKSMKGITGNERTDYLTKTNTAYESEKKESYFTEPMEEPETETDEPDEAEAGATPQASVTPEEQPKLVASLAGKMPGRDSQSGFLPFDEEEMDEEEEEEDEDEEDLESYLA